MANSYRNWQRARKAWFKANQPTYEGYYYCHYCGVPMLKSDTTLDHIKTRSEAPELRYVLSNLVPCCWLDNSRRGSMKYEAFIEKYYA